MTKQVQVHTCIYGVHVSLATQIKAKPLTFLMGIYSIIDTLNTQHSTTKLPWTEHTTEVYVHVYSYRYKYVSIYTIISDCKLKEGVKWLLSYENIHTKHGKGKEKHYIIHVPCVSDTTQVYTLPRESPTNNFRWSLHNRWNNNSNSLESVLQVIHICA